MRLSVEDVVEVLLELMHMFVSKRATASSMTPTSAKEERLEYRLALAFGFMLFIPILVFWAMERGGLNSGIAICIVVSSGFIGYFVIARPMIASVIRIAEKAQGLSSGQVSGSIDVKDQSEIGELARAFNRITQDLEQKIEELESSRQLIKKLLSRIGTAIVSYEGINNLLSLIIENAAVALEAQLGSLMLVDGETQTLSVKRMWCADGYTADETVRVKLGDGMLGWVVKEGRPMRGRSLVTELGFHSADEVEGAVLCVPLKLREASMGVLTIVRATHGAKPFVDDDELLLSSIGSQMAVAIENYRLNLDVERTYVETILALALAVEAKDPYSAGHSKRVGFYATKIGEVLGLDSEARRLLNDAGVLHDIGKIGIKDDILLKPTPLTVDEQKIMQQHPLIGEAIVKPVRLLQKVVASIRHHHEWYDGNGYPSGLKGEDIPLGARILSVADTYDSLVTDRPYRKRMSTDEARAELEQQAGKHFDPAIVEAFLKVLAEKEQRLADAKAPRQSR